MEIKLSPAEVTQIATEVVRLMKQQGLVTTTPKASKTANADATPVKGKSTGPTSAKTSAKQSREVLARMKSLRMFWAVLTRHRLTTSS